MSTLPLHPAFVHLPLGLAFAVPLLASGLVVWRVLRGRVPRGAFAILLGLQTLLVASGVVAMRLGERDERRVEAIVAEKVIEAHEERAEVFLWAAGVVLAASVALVLVPAPVSLGLSAAVAVAALGVAALGVRAGEAGGEIVYTHGGARAYVVGPAQGELAGPLPALRPRGDDD